MAKQLEGCVAFITGASSGIGEATARKLASLGATMALAARRIERLEKIAAEIAADGGVAQAIGADVADAAQAERAVAQAAKRFGRIDIVINCAGVMLIGKSEGANVEDWSRMLRINVDGTLFTTHAALPYLLDAAADGPRRVADLVNLSSSAALQVYPVNGVYALTKTGIEAFSESLRQEFTERHLRVGVIEPGAVATELVSHNTKDVQENLLATKAQPLEAADIAEAIAFMVTRPRHGAVNKMWYGPTEQV